MRKNCTVLIVVLFICTFASTALAGHELIFENAGMSVQLPDGFDAAEYSMETRNELDDQLEEYELTSIVKSAYNLPAGNMPLVGLPEIDDYVAMDNTGAYVAYIVATQDETSKRIWSFSDFDRGVLTESLNSLKTGAAEVSLYENDYVFISSQEKGKMAGNFQIACCETIENGYNIRIVVSSLQGDPLAVGKEIADAIIIKQKVSDAYIAGWVIAIIVSAALVILFMRRRKIALQIRRMEYEKIKGYGWVVILVTVSLFINVAVLLVNLFGDYSVYESSTVAAILAFNLSGLVLRVLLLFSIFKKSKFFVPLYIITILFVFIGNAAVKSYSNMAFSIIDVLICFYLLYSKRIAVIFKFREVQIFE